MNVKPTPRIGRSSTSLLGEPSGNQDSLHRAWGTTEGDLRSKIDLCSRALDKIRQGLCVFDEKQRLLLFNRRYAEMYNLAPERLWLGMTLRDVIDLRFEAGTGPQMTRAEYVTWRDQIAVADRVLETVVELRNGCVHEVHHEPTLGGGWVATFDDIKERCRTEARIRHMAGHDALTDLPNRFVLRERLEQALARTRRGEKLAVLCLDLDRFKSVNDTLGHSTGDALLCSVAQRLKKCLLEGDVVSRLGGDEFAILQIGVKRTRDPAELAKRIVASVGRPYDLGGHQVTIGTSIGIALAPADGNDPDQVLKNADLALYRAKSEGRGTYHFFEPGMDARLQSRLALESDLRNALVKGEFELFYQPLINLQRDQVSGFEALLRWRHPERGMVAPGDFIKVAEDNGFIVPIGEWVLRQACADAAHWPSEIKVAVNISPAQFKSRDLSQVVISALAAAGLPPSRLELEITETVLLQNDESILAVLHRLRGLGVRISMDDFGTGYSSLSYLRSFPFDKIDRSLVGDLATRDNAIELVRAMTGLGSSLGMVTTAEGVETQAQLDSLRGEGCTEVQGFFFSKPRPAQEIQQMLEAHQERWKSVP